MERTALAWMRTALAMAIGGAVVLGSGGSASPLAFGPAVVIAGVVLTALALARLRYRAIRAAQTSSEPVAPPAFLVGGMALATACLGLAATVFILL